jgi:hypothetical protein
MQRAGACHQHRLPGGAKLPDALLPDVLPRKGQYDHYQNHHQAHFCPQVVGQAVAFVVASHGHDLPSDASPTQKGAHEQEGALI